MKFSDKLSRQIITCNSGIKCFIGSSLEEHDEIGCYSIECQLGIENEHFKHFMSNQILKYIIIFSGIGSETLKGGYNKTGDLCATQMPQDLCYQLFRDKLILVKSCRICTEDLCNKGEFLS